MTIAYLDPDDEITSAVARLRSSEDLRVALVLPSGSRISTSRINFRLLAVEAREHQRRLSIIAGEPSVRAVAISAGLPAYDTVANYETALAEARAASGAASASEAADSTVAAAQPVVATTAGAGKPARPKRSRTRTVAAGTAAQAAAQIAVADAAVSAESSAALGSPAAAATGSEAAQPRVRPPDLPVIRTRGQGLDVGRRGLWALISAGLLGAIVLVTAAGLLVLPSATITITPRTDRVGPVHVTLHADAAASAVDVAAGVIPLQIVSLPLTASGQFAASGTKVSETKAAGTVTFTSNNTADTVFIPSGTQVSTVSGVVFLTTTSVTVPKARVKGHFTPGTRNAPVQASAAGIAGNVGAGKITQVSAAIQTALVNPDNPVSNSAATAGGTHTESKVVAQKDVDDATKSLNATLKAQLDGAAANPATAPAGATLIPGTAALGTVATSPATTSLIGTQVATFALTMTAAGTVGAANQDDVKAVAAEKLKASVPAGSQLFADSIQATPGSPSGGEARSVTIQTDATGEVYRAPDSAALLTQIKGKSVAEARRLLEPFGAVTIETWPFYVSSIPTSDSRVTLKVAPPQRTGS